jgi:hypothetical protein
MSDLIADGWAEILYHNKDVAYHLLVIFISTRHPQHPRIPRSVLSFHMHEFGVALTSSILFA